MAMLKRVTLPDSPLMATTCREVDVTDPAQIGEAVRWWEALTAAGGEGMVVKPLAFRRLRAQGSRAAGGKGARGGISADHLRPGV